MSTTGSRNTDAILQWCEIHRPGVYDKVRLVIASKNPLSDLLLSVAFEAGRRFQTTAPNPALYRPDDINYQKPLSLDDLVAGTREDS